MVVDDEDSNLYAEIQANEAEERQDSITEKDYDCLDFYRYDGLCLASITARPRPSFRKSENRDRCNSAISGWFCDAWTQLAVSCPSILLNENCTAGCVEFSVHESCMKSGRCATI